jgi:hypothetical protein
MENNNINTITNYSYIKIKENNSIYINNNFENN